MGRTTHRLVVLLAAVVAIVMTLGACQAVTSGTVSSAYDVAGMLACDPKDLPGALSKLGFTYSVGVPYGSWQTSEPVEGQPECRSNSLMLGGTSPDLLSAGNAPSEASFSFQYAPVVSEEESNAIGDDMLNRAGLRDPFYTDRVEDEEFGRVRLYRVGRIEGEGPAAYWMLLIGIDEDFGYTTYILSAYTEAAVDSLPDEALAAEGA
ncbi:hypothetical protein [Thermophilibacter provencensis]|uniref:hypothetical protein n=1 Tax=Thermophilibacter provencensis TaxID=1852386 RepID=UPI002354F5BF|nr:hypothetical protein [Thermophilibacter provencensis]